MLLSLLLLLPQQVFLLYKYYKVIHYYSLVFNEEYFEEKKCREYLLGITASHCSNIYLAQSEY